MIEPRPISSRTILACRDTLAAGLAVRLSGMDHDPAGAHVDLTGLPRTISVGVRVAPPAIVIPLRATAIETLHAEALAMAWRDGAWDLACGLIPPLEGPELGLVCAFVDYSADESLRDILLEAAERGRLARWFWRPMRDGPELRRRKHHAADSTLDSGGGRAGAVPPGLPAPNFGWRRGRDWTIRLGIAPGVLRRAGPRPRPATVAQRIYLGRLLRLAGESGRLPPRLTFDIASAWIDRLKGAKGTS